MTATGICCPFCDDGALAVMDTRPLDLARRRRYRCSAGHRFSTLEVIVENGSAVVIQLGKGGVKRMSLDAWLGRWAETASASVKKAFS